MRLQNTIAALVFLILLVSSICMQLLNLYPTNETLWYLNITYAREARPVLELLNYLPFHTVAQNILVILGLIGLCAFAGLRKSKIMTAATSHLAFYTAIFAAIASYSRTFGSVEAASLSSIDVAAFAGALDPAQLALTLLIMVLCITCLFSHYQIVSDLLRQLFARRTLPVAR